MTNKTSNAAINIHKNKNFDFSSVADLGKFWDGSGNKAGGGNFNAYSGSSSNTNHNIDLLYQNLVGRNADAGGRKYWGEKLNSGAISYQTLADSLKASDEYIGQQDHLANNPNATKDDLKSLDSAYLSPFHWASGSGAAGWTPDQKITQSVAEASQGNYSDAVNKTYGEGSQAVSDWLMGGDGSSFFGGNFGGNSFQQYDDSGLLSELASIRSAFDDYKKQSATDMQNMWNNAYGYGYGSGTVGGVRTQNELPGWAPKKGGTSGFFGRGGRSGKGLTTSSLNL